MSRWLIVVAAVNDERFLPPEIFDEMFTASSQSDRQRALFAEDLPEHVDPDSFITFAGLEDIARILDLSSGSVLIDMACGRGGPGLWLAQQSGAELVGVDFSPVGIERAKERARQRGLDGVARYLVADAAATGLPERSADGVVCVDAIQLMGHRRDVMGEVYRLLKPGARAAFTTWEEPSRLADLGQLFEEAGLEVVSIEERPDWLARERRIFETAKADAASCDDPGLANLAEEAERVLPVLELARRVLGVARRPA